MPVTSGKAMLPFEGGGCTPVQYFVQFDSTEYYVRYRGGVLEVYANAINFSDEELRLDARLGDTYDGYWNARETNVYLMLLSDSIQSGVFEKDHFPRKVAVRKHEHYRLGPLPHYPVGLICGVHEPSPPPQNKMNRHDRRKRRSRGIHDHDNRCYACIGAKDVLNWIAAHPVEHHAFKKVFPMMWESVARDMEFVG
jgi:hypothetical protein